MYYDFSEIRVPICSFVNGKNADSVIEYWYDSNSIDGLIFENFHKLLRGPRQTKDEITLKRSKADKKNGKKGKNSNKGDLQSLNPSERNVEGGNDDNISVHVEPNKRSDHDTCSHVKLVVPWRPHIHHGGVRILVPLLRRRRGGNKGIKQEQNPQKPKPRSVFKLLSIGHSLSLLLFQALNNQYKKNKKAPNALFCLFGNIYNLSLCATVS